jgi:hypothetical protein
MSDDGKQDISKKASLSNEYIRCARDLAVILPGLRKIEG